MIAIQSVSDANDLMIINKSGLTIRIGLNTLRTMGRNTQGVSLIKLKGDDAIAAVSKIDHEEDEVGENESDGENAESTDEKSAENLTEENKSEDNSTENNNIEEQ